MQNGMDTSYILALDHGTSGCKVALVNYNGEVVDFTVENTPTHFYPGGGAEQDPQSWWDAFKISTKKLLQRQKGAANKIQAISVSSTWSSTVAVDQNGKALMNSLIWMDSRGAPHVKKKVKGFPSHEGYSLSKLYKWVKLTGGIPTLSGKDDIAHMLLVKNEYPNIYAQTYKFLSSKDYLNLKLTGEFAASYDSVMLFWVTDIRDINNIEYDNSLIKHLSIDRNKLPELKSSTEILGNIVPKVAEELGLKEDVKVVMGSPDHQSALVGSGAVKDYEGHCYIGTSSWVECTVPYKKCDIFHAITSLPSSIPGKYQCVNEQDIAGGNLSYLIDNVKYLVAQQNKSNVMDNPYQTINQLASQSPPGANKIIYTPWLNGERSPVDNSSLRGGLYNLSVNNNINDIIRSIFEGVAYNTRWNMEYVERFTKRKFPEIALIGGGGESPLWCQIFADVFNRTIVKVQEPVQANARGAAFIALVGLGEISFNDVPELVRKDKFYYPQPGNRAIYDELYQEFLHVYKNNKRMFERLNKM